MAAQTCYANASIRISLCAEAMSCFLIPTIRIATLTSCGLVQRNRSLGDLLFVHQRCSWLEHHIDLPERPKISDGLLSGIDKMHATKRPGGNHLLRLHAQAGPRQFVDKPGERHERMV